MHAHLHRNFGTMHHNWQDRKNRNKKLTGFTVTFQDGTMQDIKGGLASIPDQTIQEHGHVRKSTAIEIEEE